MKALALIMIAAVELGGSFGAAKATASDLTDTSMTVDMQVEVRTSGQAVVAHLSFGDETTLTLPLLDRGGGVFGLRTELDRKNYRVVFEVVGDRDAVSEAVSLTDMGVELGDGRGQASGDTQDDDSELSAQTRGLGWLALALGAASLSALAFWVLGGRSSKDIGSDEEE